MASFTPRLGPSYQPGGQLSYDLHGSSVKEAKKTMEEIFATAEEQKPSRVTVITGVGKHSRNNYSVLFKKTVPEFLEQPEIKEKISHVTKDYRGAYEIVFKREDSVMEKTKLLQKHLGPLVYPAKDFAPIKQRAEAGSAPDQFNLAIRYQEGYGTDPNLAEAERWMVESAKNGYREAKTQLGISYDIGYRVKQNYKKALKWHTRAAEEDNDPHSLFTLGGYYWMGKIVVRDDQKALDYLSRAAALGQLEAAYNLGSILLHGTDKILADPVRANSLFKQTAKAGLVWGNVMAGKQYFFGWGIPRDYKEAHCYFLGAPEDPIAQYYLGRICTEGLDGPPNPKEGYTWFTKSATLGDKDARHFLAGTLLNGGVVPQNFPKGLEALTQLAEEGHPQSLGALGLLYVRGYGKALLADIPRGVQLLKQASVAEEPQCLSELAGLHLQKKFAGADPVEGERLLRKAAKQQDPEALFLLAMHLLKLNPANEEADDFLRRAADQGFEPAQYFFGLFNLDENEPLGLEYLERAAKQGSASAKLLLGEHLIQSESKEDQMRAVSLFAFSARKKNKEAMINLACCYRDGRGIAASEENYLHWLEEAYEAGSAFAFYEKGRCLFTQKQDKEAFPLFLRAAKEGISEARRYLFASHYFGRGTRRNIPEAIRILKEIAEERVAPEEELFLGRIYMDPKTGYLNYKEALLWFGKSLEHGHPEAATFISHIYQEQPDTKELAFYHLKKAALQNNVEALRIALSFATMHSLPFEEPLIQLASQGEDCATLFMLALHLMTLKRFSEIGPLLDRSAPKFFAQMGQDPKFALTVGQLYNFLKEDQKAIDWLKRAPENPEAITELADLYIEQGAAAKDPLERCKAFRQAAKLKHPYAATTLACLLLNGAEEVCDLNEVHDLLRLGVAFGYDHAELTLGKLYIFESIDPSAHAMGMQLLERASLQGNQEAKELLTSLRKGASPKEVVVPEEKKEKEEEEVWEDAPSPPEEPSSYGCAVM